MTVSYWVIDISDEQAIQSRRSQRLPSMGLGHTELPVNNESTEQSGSRSVPDVLIEA
jgi:hypothetical protein